MPSRTTWVHCAKLYPKSITPTASSMSSRIEWQQRLTGDEQIGALILNLLLTELQRRGWAFAEPDRASRAAQSCNQRYVTKPMKPSSW